MHRKIRSVFGLVLYVKPPESERFYDEESKAEESVYLTMYFTRHWDCLHGMEKCNIWELLRT